MDGKATKKKNNNIEKEKQQFTCAAVLNDTAFHVVTS